MWHSENVKPAGRCWDGSTEHCKYAKNWSWGIYRRSYSFQSISFRWLLEYEYTSPFRLHSPILALILTGQKLLTVGLNKRIL